MQLSNYTPYAAEMMPMTDTRGEPCLCVVVKATYTLAQEPQMADAQYPVILDASYLGEPVHSSFTAVHELGLPTGETSIVLLGDAWAPNGHPVRRLDSILEVFGRRKVVRVFGDRVWRSYALRWATAPLPFVRMPLTWERAFGGTVMGPSGPAASFADNPLGQGYRGPRTRRAMRGTALPNLELPQAPGRAACFGYVHPHWPERLGLMGTYDAAWVQSRAPRRPIDFDRRSGRMGPADMCFAQPLTGGEPITLTHLAPQPHLRCTLPRLRLWLEVGEAACDPIVMGLETVVLLPNDGLVTLLYKALVPCGPRVPITRPIAVRAHATSGLRK